MDPDNDQPVTLNEAATSAFAELGGTTQEVTPALATPAEAPWEPPAFTSRWSESARNALKEFGGASHNRKFLDPILGQFEEHNKKHTQHQQEFSDYRKTVDPVYNVLRDLEPSYRIQGMSLEQGVSQLVEGAKFVATNPDQAFPYFAGMYRPQNPAEAVLGIAKQWGVDLGQLTQEQPYIDPTVQALLAPMQQELAYFRNAESQREQAARQRAHQEQVQLQNAVVEKLTALETQKDESGNLRFPYLKDVFDDILLLANSGRVKTIEDAYDRAVQMNPELAQSAVKNAEQRAINEAAARSQAVLHESQANRSVTGKGRREEGAPNLTLRQTATEAYRELANK